MLILHSGSIILISVFPIRIFPMLSCLSGSVIIPMFCVRAYNNRFLKASIFSIIPMTCPSGILRLSRDSEETSPGYLSRTSSNLISQPRGLSIFLLTTLALFYLFRCFYLSISKNGTQIIKISTILIRKNVQKLIVSLTMLFNTYEPFINK